MTEQGLTTARAKELRLEKGENILQESLDKFSSRLVILIMIICAVVFCLCIYRRMTLLDSMMFAVALAVAAIPEALSSIVTIVQAFGTQKMACVYCLLLTRNRRKISTSMRSMAIPSWG